MPNFVAANAASRDFNLRAASRAAMPFRSLPDDAAVGAAFGTLLVSDALTRMRARRDPQLLRDDLRHLGEQALAHLGAAVIEQHGAVVVECSSAPAWL